MGKDLRPFVHAFSWRDEPLPFPLGLPIHLPLPLPLPAVFMFVFEEAQS